MDSQQQHIFQFTNCSAWPRLKLSQSRSLNLLSTDKRWRRHHIRGGGAIQTLKAPPGNIWCWVLVCSQIITKLGNLLRKTGVTCPPPPPSHANSILNYYLYSSSSKPNISSAAQNISCISALQLCFRIEQCIKANKSIREAINKKIRSNLGHCPNRVGGWLRINLIFQTVYEISIFI